MKHFSMVAALGLALASAGCASGTKSANNPDGETQSQQVPIDQSALSQSEAAQVREVLELIDAGQYAAAEARCLQLLEQHPHQWEVTFELALTYRLQGKPKQAVSVLSPYTDSMPAQGMAALASALDEAGDARQAMKVVDQGLARAPESGLLYSTKGVILSGQGDNGSAYEAFEKGAQVDPASPSNHLQLALLFAGSDLGVFTLLHGEIFRNLEPASERSRKVGALMVQTISERVTIQKDADGNAGVSVRLVAPEVTGGDPSHPLQVYELALGLPLSVVVQDGLTFEELIEARGKFVEIWWEQSQNGKLPLASFLHDLSAAGHLEAYHAWLFAPGYADEANAWFQQNESKMEAFQAYMNEHSFESYL